MKTKALFAVAMLSCVVSGIAGEGFVKPERLVLAHSWDMFPYFFPDASGKPAGFLVDLWSLWSEKTGVEVTFLVSTWDESLDAVREGRADAHAGLFDTPERRAYFDFAPIGINVDTVLFVSDIVRAASVSELMGLPIGVIRGDYSGEHLRSRYAGLSVVEFGDTVELFRALEEKRLFAFADDVPRTIRRLSMSSDLLGSFRPLSTLYSKELAIGVRKGEGELLEFLRQGMALVQQSERDALAQKWVPYVQSEYGFRFSWAIAGWISLGALFVFFIVALFVLEARVRSRTKALRETMAEREKLIASLEEALANVKRLDGLLPICANCKKIRNDAGYWEQVETYVRERSEARFSHGICPECARLLYGDILDSESLDGMK